MAARGPPVRLIPARDLYCWTKNPGMHRAWQPGTAFSWSGCNGGIPAPFSSPEGHDPSPPGLLDRLIHFTGLSSRGPRSRRLTAIKESQLLSPLQRGMS
ncbi:hypothetical protein NDU88_001985 [Pleurodeles waltl]|uniref:Uncharacterized protein n=1 Tax=Pleurodeles waltl TaxID=8319 RepID=A0AAV7WNX4_PLEWA|nr:hypothetical protein NDU88_001985 [Pleurodeles waltl]